MNYMEHNQCTSDRIYQHIADKLREAGGEVPCTPEAFHLFATEGRAELDYLKLMNLDNLSFLQAIYSISFNTFPPEEYISVWQKSIDTLPEEEFQRKFINAFVRAKLFTTQHIRLRNCICLDGIDSLAAKKNS